MQVYKGSIIISIYKKIILLHLAST